MRFTTLSRIKRIIWSAQVTTATKGLSYVTQEHTCSPKSATGIRFATPKSCFTSWSSTEQWNSCSLSGLEDQPTGTGTLRQNLVRQLFALREQPWLWDLSHLFDKAVSLLPKFDQSPENAYRDLEYQNRYKEERPHIGGITMTCGPDGITEIRLSTRTLLDLLSGRISQERFIKYYSHDNGVGIFESILRDGRLITEASVKKLPNEDDDEIVLTFGKPDAAAGPFVVPQRSRSTTH